MGRNNSRQPLPRIRSKAGSAGAVAFLGVPDDGQKEPEAAQASVRLPCPIFELRTLAVGLNILLPKALDALRQQGLPVSHIAKKATQDGTFTVYVENRPVARGLTWTHGDIPIHELASPAASLATDGRLTKAFIATTSSTSGSLQAYRLEQ